MIKAELEYNPYLLETKVRFNGKEPKINSLVERYEHAFLQDWVKDLPNIFYNEMNGYNFQLDFSGTDLDFDEIRQSLMDAGITEDQIKLFHKSSLSDRASKRKQISELLSWMENNPNHLFDSEDFQKENEKILDSNFIFKVIMPKGSPLPTSSQLEEKAEIIYDIEEMDDADLNFVPIVIFVNEQNVQQLPYYIPTITQREDVTLQQLFFILDSKLKRAEVERVIQDLDIPHPQIVDSLSDNEIQRYFELYPISDYIHKTVEMFEDEKQSISDVLERENDEIEIKNSGAHQIIEQHEEEIAKLKESYEEFANRNNLDRPIEFSDAKNRLIDRVRNWKNRKSKTTSEDDAERLASDYNELLFRAIQVFVEDIDRGCNKRKFDINAYFDNWSVKLEQDVRKEANITPLNKHKQVSSPIITEKLMEIRSEEKIEDNDRLARFFGKSQDNDNGVETVWSLQRWREYVCKEAETFADDLIGECEDNLNIYYNDNSDACEQYLNDQITIQVTARDNEMDMLSDDEKQLQADKDWVLSYGEQLASIERG